jgi:hypothetical protein
MITAGSMFNSYADVAVRINTSAFTMATAREIALEVLPHFKENILAGRVLTYGVYARAIGRKPSKDAMAIGKAMHIIGATCVLARIPIAPLHYVSRADHEWRGIFESDSIEQRYVLPHYDLLLVTARVYRYTEEDFRRIEKGLREVIPRYIPRHLSSPHQVWHIVALNKLDDGRSILDVALEAYREILAGANSLSSRAHANSA